MSQRSRKRGQREAPAAREPEGPSRSELRNAAAREGLEPLADGERPLAITIAVVVALALAALVLVGYSLGARVGDRGTLAGAVFIAAILLIAAGGMWRMRYWAVLGFEALLAFQVIIAGLSLAVASNLWAAALCLLVIGLGGWLFWKLVRAMARIQMPERKAPSR